MIAANPASAANLNKSQYDHLLHEHLITGELVRIIGAASTWHEATEAALALVHIRQMAKSMKAERDMHTSKDAAMRSMQAQAQAQDQGAQSAGFDIQAFGQIRGGSSY